MIPKVLITGGFGYVGGRVACTLANAGYDIRIATRRKDATPPSWLPEAEVVPLDYHAPDTVKTACTGVDVVLHLAALNEIDSGAHPVEAANINATGALVTLLTAEEQGVKRFVYFSTAHVYGAPLVGTITEENLPRPAHAYSITHRVAEDWVLAAHDRREIDGVVVRLSNGFGAPKHPYINRWTLIANDLCRQAVTQRKLTLRSSGIQLRDFITLEDVGAAVNHLIRLPTDALEGGLFNLGGRLPLSIYDMTQLVQQRCEAVLGFRPPIERPEPQPGETAALLDYRVDKLLRTGFRLTGDVNAEIDSTLILCRDSFAT